jgi:hypothetical protein
VNSKLACTLSLALAATGLGGCYVIPIDGRYPGLPQPAVPGAIATPTPVTLHARLYPLNDAAGKMGALSAVVSDNTQGHGTFSLTVAGEALQGEASRASGGQRGIASAAGTRGTYVNCEYALTGVNRGTGSCLFSNGAKYQLHFGG